VAGLGDNPLVPHLAGMLPMQIGNIRVGPRQQFGYDLRRSLRPAGIAFREHGQRARRRGDLKLADRHHDEGLLVPWLKKGPLQRLKK
jgi:hypothetical protein